LWFKNKYILRSTWKIGRPPLSGTKNKNPNAKNGGTWGLNVSYQFHIPNVITSVRFLAAPIFIYVFLNDLFLISASILVLTLITDVLDGHIARKLDATTDFGAYLDVTADFILIVACFVAYVIHGWYNPLILLPIVGMFLLFVATSGLAKPIYDPIGKHIGTYLMLMVFISLLFPLPFLREALLVLLVVICLASMAARFSVYVNKRENA